MMLEESIRILAMQEEILQFSHFTNEDAWELGSLMVRTMEMSSLRLFMTMKKNGETLEDKGLNGQDYAALGGGFPIRLAKAGVIGSIIVSGLDHMADHEFAAACISQYLRVDGIPRLPVSF